MYIAHLQILLCPSPVNLTAEHKDHSGLGQNLMSWSFTSSSTIYGSHNVWLSPHVWLWTSAGRETGFCFGIWAHLESIMVLFCLSFPRDVMAKLSTNWNQNFPPSRVSPFLLACQAWANADAKSPEPLKSSVQQRRLFGDDSAISSFGDAMSSFVLLSHGVLISGLLQLAQCITPAKIL